MLDTNIVSALIRSPHGPLRARISAFGESDICISIMSAAELHYGGHKKGSIKLIRDIEALVASIPVVPFEAPADREYALIRSELTAAGTPIGPVDFFIAAHALALGMMLVTANIGEFSRVPGLRVENWLD